MICSQGGEVFCDWLDVTFSPDDHPLESLRLWFDANLWPVRFTEPLRSGYDVGFDIASGSSSGVLVVEDRDRFARISASGGVLRYLRANSLLEDYLGLLAQCPHKVTRLDAACDYPIDGPDALRSLEAAYPDDRVSFQRKALKVTRLYSAREDGRQTGTWYAGHRSSARVTARVYDKQCEAYEKRGEYLPPTTRVELSFRKDHGCTLRDAIMPTSLYYQYASPVLVKRPQNVPDWVSHAEPWVGSPPPVKLDYEVFKRRLETSPELLRLAELAAMHGESGEALLLRTFADAVRSKVRSLGAAVGE